jgi:hypothetical protein
MKEYHPRYPELTVSREKRQSMALSVTPLGEPILRIPYWISLNHPQVRKFIQSNLHKLAHALTPQPRTQQTDERTIRQMVAEWAKRIAVQPKRLQFRDMRRKWGSCSSRGNLTLNTALFYVPRELAEYVVVHELVHLIIFNHSAEFWAKLGEYLPDYAEREQQLKSFRVW